MCCICFEKFKPNLFTTEDVCEDCKKRETPMVTVGRIVHLYPGASAWAREKICTNGNPGPVPAIVTRVWNEDCINVTAFPDNAPPVLLTSVFKRTPAEAERAAALPNLSWDLPPRA